MSDVLPKYSFLPWLRQGIANQINDEDNLGAGPVGTTERVKIELQVKVKGNGSVVSTINSGVKLIGPGDIIGLSPNSIIKTEPLNWITNFEPNYFPYVEFYDEDFPWRYTPASPTTSHKLRPWLALVVLKEDEFEKIVGLEDGMLNSIKLEGELDPADPAAIPFPPYNETWAWAHVHANADLHADAAVLTPSDSAQVQAGVDRLQNLISGNPDSAISRIICPRELEPNTDYHAFLIPSFETGRLAGLGTDPSVISGVDAQLPSWGPDATIHAQLPKQWPIYHEHYFKTGVTGDFEYLVRQIVPRVLDERVGKRPMDIQDPGYGLDHSAAAETTLFLEGALRIPGNDGEPYPWLPTDGPAINFREGLRNLVNLGQNTIADSLGGAINNPIYNGLVIGGSGVQDDPIVAPPLYGRWHALTKNVDETTTDWTDELNLDPRNRVVAGIGTGVIQKNQDQFMDMAWDQVGEVIEANKKLKWAQVAKEAGSAMFIKHIKSQPIEEKLQLTSKLHKKVKSTSGGTVFKQNKESILPVASESRAYRKVRRTNGPLMRRMDPLKVIANTVGAGHITSRMADNTAPLQAAAQKEIAVNATKAEVGDFDGVVSFSSGINTTGYTFDLSNPGSVYAPAANNSVAEAFKSAVEVYQNHFAALNWAVEPTPPSLDLQEVSDDIDANANPQTQIPLRAYHPQKLNFSKPYTLPAEPYKIVPILAAPAFKQPMYEAVRDESTDLLIPNLNLITNNTISLLETNPKFIESYMVGLNHEMGRELLWREYPTDQRGTYFKHFWDATDFVDTTELLTRKQLEDKTGDITEIHTWAPSEKLGTHNNRSTDGGTTSEAQLVLVVRGDLLKKYPSSVIYAQKAKWQLKDDGTGNMIDDYTMPRQLEQDTESYPVFGAKIEPDINFIGFDITACEAKGDEVLDENAPHNSYDPGYFFIIKERPGEARFGADLEDTSGTGSPSPATWNDLRWDHITKANGHVQLTGGVVTPSNANIPAIPAGLTVEWSDASTSADLAMATFQNPVLVAIHAKEMLNVDCS